jgi:hypothetical protein
MVNHFATVTADRGLKSTRLEYNALKAALEADEDNAQSGLEIEYYDGEVYVFGSESADWEALPRAFRTLLGTLIAKNGLKYLEFGPAFACDTPRMGSSCATYIRIKTNGSVWEPKLTW